MNDLWHWVVPALIIALIFYLTARAVIGHYFTAKGGFVEKMANKLKGANDGKRP
jgi:hypothetical protein